MIGLTRNQKIAKAMQWLRGSPEGLKIVEATPDKGVRAATAKMLVEGGLAEWVEEGVSIRLARCRYPHCKCIVQTSTSQWIPECPLDLVPAVEGDAP